MREPDAEGAWVYAVSPPCAALAPCRSDDRGRRPNPAGERLRVTGRRTARARRERQRGHLEAGGGPDHKKAPRERPGTGGFERGKETRPGWGADKGAPDKRTRSAPDCSLPNESAAESPQIPSPPPAAGAIMGKLPMASRQFAAQYESRPREGPMSSRKRARAHEYGLERVQSLTSCTVCSFCHPGRCGSFPTCGTGIKPFASSLSRVSSGVSVTVRSQ